MYGEEGLDVISDIVRTYGSGNKLEGQDYTNGNSNREV